MQGNATFTYWKCKKSLSWEGGHHPSPARVLCALGQRCFAPSYFRFWIFYSQSWQVWQKYMESLAAISNSRDVIADMTRNVIGNLETLERCILVTREIDRATLVFSVAVVHLAYTYAHTPGQRSHVTLWAQPSCIHCIAIARSKTLDRGWFMHRSNFTKRCRSHFIARNQLFLHNDVAYQSNDGKYDGLNSLE